ncbi:MAG TPA: hypothetical protein PLB94_10370 [Microbacteriaceae bacterium]|nr:hypothetical protein [Actinomycetota bacterium]HPT96132.1 hypothetical protein [Microbacteriaceae bacterium]
MKIFTRIAAVITAALVSFFVATPALAHEGEKHDVAAEFSSAGQPVDVVAILIVGAVLLFVVLLTAQLVGNLFEKSGK